MAKVQITEAKLNQIIQESIYEILQEAQEDEGLGGFLGRLGQGVKNKINHFKQDYNLGKNYARYKDRNYNPGEGDSFYSKHGLNAGDFMNFNGQTNANYRKSYMDSVRQNSDNSWTDQFGNTTKYTNPNMKSPQTDTQQGNESLSPAPEEQQGQKPTVGQSSPRAESPSPAPGAAAEQNPTAQQYVDQNAQNAPAAETAPASNAAAPAQQSSDAIQAKIGQLQRTAQAFMSNMRGGQPFKVDQSTKLWLTKAVNSYSKNHPNAVSNAGFAKLSRAIGAIKNGQPFNPQGINMQQVQTLFNDFAKTMQWQMNEAIKREKMQRIIAESVHKAILKEIKNK